jgi:hypothetical protein
MAIEKNYFADKAPNESAENRSASPTPNTSSVEIYRLREVKSTTAALSVGQ